MNVASSNVPKSNNAPKSMNSFTMAAPLTTAVNVANNVADTVTNTANNAAVSMKNAAVSMKNAVANTATNVSNSVKNVFSVNSLSDLTEPITESVNASLENTTSPYITIPMMLILGVLIITFILFIVFRDQIVFGLSVAWQKIKDLFSSSTPPPPPAPPTVPDLSAIDGGAVNQMLPARKQVFNVAVDKYTYSDAEPLCKAFGAELATYDQVKDAWNKGADWCNYGWVKGQSAVYPTQQSTYDKLQAGPESQRMSCGVPGVNGGYFDNPELRFGVNCYGKRPSENDTDKRYATEKAMNLTPDALEYDKKVQNYKMQRDQIPVNSFNTGSWSS